MLLACAESSTRRNESARLQLDSNKSVLVTAPWKVTYNPTKPLMSKELSESCNGVFYVIANGTPGDKDVSITLRLRYRVHFYGTSISLTTQAAPGAEANEQLRKRIQELEAQLAQVVLN